MNVHCPDQDLLFLAHQELSWGRKIVTQAHITVCPLCQSRLAKLTGASRLLADTIRGSDLPRWPSSTPQSLVAVARTATLWRLAVGLLVLLSVAVITTGVRQTSQRESTHRLQIEQQSHGGCRPDLPSDKCK